MRQSLKAHPSKVACAVLIRVSTAAAWAQQLEGGRRLGGPGLGLGAALGELRDDGVLDEGDVARALHQAAERTLVVIVVVLLRAWTLSEHT